MLAESIWKLRSLIFVFYCSLFVSEYILSSYTRLWNVVVLIDLKLPEDDNGMAHLTSLSSRDDKHPLVTAMGCTLQKHTFWKLWAQRNASKLHSFLTFPKPRAQLSAIRLSSEYLLLAAPYVTCSLRSGIAADWLWSHPYCVLKQTHVHFWNVYL